MFVIHNCYGRASVRIIKVIPSLIARIICHAATGEVRATGSWSVLGVGSFVVGYTAFLHQEIAAAIQHRIVLIWNSIYSDTCLWDHLRNKGNLIIADNYFSPWPYAPHGHKPGKYDYLTMQGGVFSPLCVSTFQVPLHVQWQIHTQREDPGIATLDCRINCQSWNLCQ